MLSSSLLVSRDTTVSCNLRVNIAFIMSVLLECIGILIIAVVLSYCCIQNITSGQVDWTRCQNKMYLICVLDFDTVLK